MFIATLLRKSIVGRLSTIEVYPVCAVGLVDACRQAFFPTDRGNALRLIAIPVHACSDCMYVRLCVRGLFACLSPASPPSACHQSSVLNAVIEAASKSEKAYRRGCMVVML